MIALPDFYGSIDLSTLDTVAATLRGNSGLGHFGLGRQLTSLRLFAALVLWHIGLGHFRCNHFANSALATRCNFGHLYKRWLVQTMDGTNDGWTIKDGCRPAGFRPRAHQPAHLPHPTPGQQEQAEQKEKMK